MASGIGAAMAGGKRGKASSRKRQMNDWYPTPADVSRVLFDRVAFNGDILEPCCGDGAVARIAEHYGHKVIGTDLHDRGYGQAHGPDYDILKTQGLLARNVVTNPPFKIAREIIETIMPLQPDKLALLLKSTFWHAKNRTALFERYPPARIIALNWRVDFLKLKRPTMEVIWCVWDKGHCGPTVFEIARRPTKNAYLDSLTVSNFLNDGLVCRKHESDQDFLVAAE